MRAALFLTACLVACAPTALAAPSRSPAASAALDSTAGCQPTSSRDAAGVLTANGVFGVLGDTSTFSDVAMNEPLVIVRRDAKEQDTLALVFNSIGHSSPATAVSYGVGARVRPNPWGGFVFEAGWKPIGFAGSCWRVIANGEDTGLVLFVRP
jgi:hypothetical protein